MNLVKNFNKMKTISYPARVKAHKDKQFGIAVTDPNTGYVIAVYDGFGEYELTKDHYINVEKVK